MYDYLLCLIPIGLIILFELFAANGKSRHDEEEQSILIDIKRSQEDWHYWRDNQDRIMNQVERHWHWGEPETVSKDLANLSMGRRKE